MNAYAHKIIDTTADVVRLYIKTRFVRNPGSAAITTGLILLALLLSAAYSAKGALNLPWLQLEAKTSSQPIQPVQEYILFGVAIFLILCGAGWLFYCAHRQNSREAEASDRKVVLCVQLDAYNEVIPLPLTSAVPTRLKGRRILILVRKRDFLVGGNNLQDVALEILNIKSNLLQHANGLAPDDISVCAGGLAPVPFLFMFGNVLEDDRPINWAELHRNSGQWLWDKDGSSVQSWGIPNLDGICSSDVVLRSGITYSINADDVSKAFPDKEIVIWEPTEKLFQVIIDEASCNAICDDFKKLLRQLGSKGVKRVHFLLACSTLLTMRLGSVFDPRNMPDVIVYQYEKNSELIYTWGVGIEAHEGRKKPIINDRRIPASRG